MVDVNINSETADPVSFNKWEKFEEEAKCSSPADCAAISVPLTCESSGQAALLNGETPAQKEQSDSTHSPIFTETNKTDKSSLEDKNEHSGNSYKQKKSEPRENSSISSDFDRRDTHSPGTSVDTSDSPDLGRDQLINTSSPGNGEGKINWKSRTKGVTINGDRGIESDSDVDREESIAVTRASSNRTVTTTPRNSKLSHFDKASDKSKITAADAEKDTGYNVWVTFEEDGRSGIEERKLIEEKPRIAATTTGAKTEAKPSIVEQNMALLQTSNVSICDKNALVEDMFSHKSDPGTSQNSTTGNVAVLGTNEAAKQRSKGTSLDKTTAVLQTSAKEKTSTRDRNAVTSSNSPSETTTEATNKTAGKTITTSNKSWVNFDDDNSSSSPKSKTNEISEQRSVRNATQGKAGLGEKTQNASQPIQNSLDTSGVQGIRKISGEKEAVESTSNVDSTNNKSVTSSSVSGALSSCVPSSPAQNQWVTFEESTTTATSVKTSKHLQSQNTVTTTTAETTTTTVSGSSDTKEPAAKKPPTEGEGSAATSQQSDTPKSSWVTFSDETDGGKQKSELSSLSVVIPVQNSVIQKEPSTPSPNPFLNAPKGSIPNQGVSTNPFKVPAETPLSTTTSTNPFRPAGEPGNAVQVSPFPGGTTQATPPPLGGLSAADLDILEGITQTPPPVKSVVTPMPPTKTETPKSASVPANVGVAVPEENPLEKVIPESDLPLDELPVLASTNSWSMLLRYPDTKKRIGSRDWKPVVIKLEGSTLQFYEEYELSAPFREIPLQACFAFSEPVLQGHHNHKVHTVKLEYVKYKESRKVRKGGGIEHIAISNPIIKVGTSSHLVMKKFMESVSDSLRTLPAYRDRGITYSRDEVFIDVDDTCDILSNGNGTILKQVAKVQIKLRAFLTGDSECQLVLNDAVVKEREEARLRGELKPQRVHHWVKLQKAQFHKCVNSNSFDTSHSIMFHPLDACTFELMRFRVPQTKQLPLQIKASLNVHNEQRIELKAEIQVCQDAKLAKYERNNVVFRFPIPDSWVPLFRRSKTFGGEKSIKSTKGRRATGIKGRLKHSKCSIAASIGTAKYEPEYAAIMWRIDKLPLIQSKIPVDAPQTLTCRLELPTGMEYPDHYEPFAELSYDIAYVLVSDTTVIAVKVSNQNIPEKWVCYRAFYHYHIQMDVSRPNSGPIRDVGCSQQ